MCERACLLAINAVVMLQNCSKSLLEQNLAENRAYLGEIQLFVYLPWKRPATDCRHVPNKILQPTPINEAFHALRLV